MNLANYKNSTPKLLAAVLALLTLQCITLPAMGQTRAQDGRQRTQDDGDLLRRGRPPYVQAGNAGYQVWLGVDVLRKWMPAENGFTNYSSGSSLDQHGALAGAWTAAEVPGLVLTLQADGNFALATSANLDKRCAGGTERGNWDFMAGPSQLRFHIKTDTNGRCGFSDLDAPMTVRLTDSGILMITNESSEDEVPLVRR